ncbi:MAG TPA: protein phosphatase 2C domain-containing protein [Microbacteriaceae bacterium]|nr:protein phosphatase 2C domain-containing protein [Microbacteriaceae bacterium]
MTRIGHDSDHDVVVTPAGQRIGLSWSGLTDIGKRRAVNEDSLVTKPPIFAVADGMGGHSAGDVASAAVVTRLAGEAAARFTARGALDRALRRAVVDIERRAGHSDLGTGTTVTGVALTLVGDEPYWLVFNIGDSRVYRQTTSRGLERLTIDHSVVQELVDAGEITADEADGHPQSNIITRAVGFNELPVPDYRLVPLDPGSRLLLCSDGLTKEVGEKKIAAVLAHGRPASATAGDLVELALGGGGRDNVTVVVVDVAPFPGAAHGEG